MKNVYISPELSVINTDLADIITTSDIEAGVETTPVSDNGGSWESL